MGWARANNLLFCARSFSCARSRGTLTSSLSFVLASLAPQLRGLVSGLERTRDSTLKKLELKTAELVSARQDVEKERERGRVLVSKCVNLEQDKEVLRRNLEVVDSEKDAMEAKLDEMSHEMRDMSGRLQVRCQ